MIGGTLLPDLNSLPIAPTTLSVTPGLRTFALTGLAGQRRIASACT